VLDVIVKFVFAVAMFIVLGVVTAGAVVSFFVTSGQVGLMEYPLQVLIMRVSLLKLTFSSWQSSLASSCLLPTATPSRSTNNTSYLPGVFLNLA
jgi:hypothetical protein